MSGLRDRRAFEREERERLAPWAVKSAESKGRLFDQPEHEHRTAFQRDRDRIVHSQAFRRLEYKTQVFVHHEGDHHRNRLTHTLEASQISRSLARMLRLNEELAEAIVLAHDLGHTPFGHAGERVLSDLMKSYGDFDHNRQSLRIVDLLEERYPDFRGLNLTWETREGILKHGCHWEHPVPVPERLSQPSVEAQVADHADEIAYTNHDLDDGLRAGLITLDELAEIPLWRDTRARVSEAIGGSSEATERLMRAQTVIALINHLVTDLAEETARRLDAAAPADVEAVRRLADRPAGFSPAVAGRLAELKRFLSERFYHHPTVLAMSAPAESVIGDLFRHFREHARELPSHVQARFGTDGVERAIADYVAGMTDRFALQEHARATASGSA
ncbi:MAG: deoxyguanosinetriphosphate triphosphohydrolase [Myxococcota bacterium]